MNAADTQLLAQHKQAIDTQVSRAQEITNLLEEADYIDLLDALASAGYELTPISGETNIPSLAFIRSITAQ